MTARTVWLASYPKSGNTWIRAIYTAWRTGGPVDLDRMMGGPVATFREHFDVATGIPSSSMTRAEIELVRPRVDEVIAAEEDGPRLRKIHDCYHRGPAGEPIVSVAATRAAIYVIRDPRDVAVSYAHHTGTSLDEAVRVLGDPGAARSSAEDHLPEQLPHRLGTWSEHVLSWVDETPFPVEVVRYEDLAARPVATAARALRMVAPDGVDEAAVLEAVEHAAFERLSHSEATEGFAERPAPNRAFFRRGTAGSWHDELPPALAARVEQDHGPVMARFGYA